MLGSGILTLKTKMQTTHVFGVVVFLLFVLSLSLNAHSQPSQTSPPRTRSFITRRCGRWISVTLITIDPAKIRDVEIVKTIVGGKTVWDSNQNATDNKGR